ncbi:MAG: helix-turn-helix domain-containing protein [Ignavibacteriae bacterium]|nr:helix-turn-helix domain-containing protein [Ignavibacteriota bacterium]
MEENNVEIKLYSISAAAKSMCISRDALRNLINDGKIGYIQILKNKKIPHQEFVRFQKENTIVSKSMHTTKALLTTTEINNFFNTSKGSCKSLKGETLLQNIIRKDENGNSKTKR